MYSIDGCKEGRHFLTNVLVDESRAGRHVLINRFHCTNESRAGRHFLTKRLIVTARKRMGQGNDFYTCFHLFTGGCVVLFRGVRGFIRGVRGFIRGVQYLGGCVVLAGRHWFFQFLPGWQWDTVNERAVRILWMHSCIEFFWSKAGRHFFPVLCLDDMLNDMIYNNYFYMLFLHAMPTPSDLQKKTDWCKTKRRRTKNRLCFVGRRSMMWDKISNTRKHSRRMRTARLRLP